MLKYLLLGCALCLTSQVLADGDAKNMTDHELHVKASWNRESAQRWCAEDQSFYITNVCVPSECVMQRNEPVKQPSVVMIAAQNVQTEAVIVVSQKI